MECIGKKIYIPVSMFFSIAAAVAVSMFFKMFDAKQVAQF